MDMDQIIHVLVTITLIEMMVAIGLGVTFVEMARVAKDWRLLVRAAVANYVCVPAVTVGLLLLFRPQPLVAVGFLILAACPGAPYGPPFAAVARGNVASAVGLMVILAGSSALLAPLLLHFLLDLVAGEEPLQVDARRIAGTLLVTQLLPLCAGVMVRQWYPWLAERVRQPALGMSKILNLVTVGLILTAQGHLVMEVRPRGFVGMALLLIACWAAGWLFGGRGADNRITMMLTTALRNVGVGLVIATGSFAGTPALTATLVYGLFEVLGSLLLALALARRATEASAADSDDSRKAGRA